MRDLAAAGVQTGVHYTPGAHQHAAWGAGVLPDGSLPGAEAWAREEVSLPMFPELRPDEVARVATAVTDAARAQAPVVA